MALSASRDTPMWAPQSNTRSYKVDGGSVIYNGALVALNSAGYLVPGSTATTLLAVGRANETVDNTDGGDGAVRCNVEVGVFRWDNTSVATETAIGTLAYIIDDQAVSTNASGKSIAGVIMAVDSVGIWVDTRLEAAIDNTVITAYISDVASTSNGQGASLVGVEDAGSYFANATVEGALIETMTKTRSVISVPIPAYSAIANSGVLMRLTPGYVGRILGMHVQATTAVTAGSKLATLTPKIATVAVTGGVVSMTSAGQNAIGAVQNGTTVTAANTFTAIQEITVEASSVTAFTEGAGVIYLCLG